MRTTLAVSACASTRACASLAHWVCGSPWAGAVLSSLHASTTRAWSSSRWLIKCECCPHAHLHLLSLEASSHCKAPSKAKNRHLSGPLLQSAMKCPSFPHLKQHLPAHFPGTLGQYFFLWLCVFFLPPLPSRPVALGLSSAALSCRTLVLRK